MLKLLGSSVVGGGAGQVDILWKASISAKWDEVSSLGEVKQL